MSTQRPTTIDAYIEAAPEQGRPHLLRLRALLQSVAPEADEVIKWNTPFFVEPRFLFAFSAHKAHLGFMPSQETMDAFRHDLNGYHATKRGILKVPYAGPFPERLIRRIAEHQRGAVSRRGDEAFW